MMRRLIAGFLTVCMMLSICPPEAFVVHTSATDISVTEPVVTEPVTEPVVTEPVVTEPVTEPVVTEPATEPAVTEPVTEPAVTEPAPTEATEAATEATEAATETTEPIEETSEPTEETTEPTEETSEPTEETTEPEEIVDYKTMTAGSTITLVASGKIGGYWSSYNPNLATVEGKIDEQGRAAAKVTGLVEGTVTVAYVLENHVEKWIITITPAPTEATEETTEATEAATEATQEATEATEETTEATEETTEATAATTEAAEETTEATEAATEAAEETTEAPEETTEATEETTEAPAEQTGTLTADRTSIHVGETARLTGTSSSWLCNYSGWSTDRTEVATVSADGVVTAVSVGDVTVTHEYCTSHGLIIGHHLEQETLTIHVAEAVQLESLEIKGAAGLAMGETLQLSVRAYPQGAVAEVEWGSSDESVLTVDQNGLVTPLKEGSAFVIASCGIIVDYREITVSPALNQDAEEDDLLGGNTLGLGDGASTFALIAEKTTIAVGESTTLTGSQNARYDDTSGRNDCGFEHQWSVRQDPDECANVTYSGNTATVKGLKPGTVTIDHTYCTSTRRYYHSHSTTKETITITVLEPVALESLTITGGDTVRAGETIQLRAELPPADATNVSLVWSTNSDIITVDQNGDVTGVKAGTAIVTVAGENTGIADTQEITVIPTISLQASKTNLTQMGETSQITPTVTGFENYRITWSADPALVSVNGGLVTVTGGSTTSQEVTITATATSLDEDTYDQTVTSTITLTVQFNSYPLYYYALIPGKDANTSGNPDSRWFGLGVAQIEGVADPAGLGTGTAPTSYKINTANANPAIYPTVTYDNVEYRFAPQGSENANKEGFYTLSPLRIRVANGANAGYNNYNTTTGEKTYHYDHTIVLNEKDIYTVNFLVKDPGYDTFAAVESGAQRVQKGTLENTLKRPTMAATQEYDGLTYKFDGWYTDEACTQKAAFDGTITANTGYYGKYVPTEQYYTVEYYYDSQISQSQTVRGGPVNVGTETSTYPDKIITGFRFFCATVPLTITADAAQNVIRVYYVSRTYTVTYTDGVDAEEVFPDQVTENVTHNAPTPAFNGTPKRTGYAFTDWNPAVAETVTQNVTYVAQWEQSDFTLTIKYVYEDRTEAVIPCTKTFTYGSKYSVTSPEIPGYTADLTVVEATMPAEDVTVTVTYKANTNTPYTVEHYQESLDGTYTLKETENLTGTTDTTATAQAKTYEGFTFDESVDGTVKSGIITADGNLVLKLYYKRINDLSYTVHYYWNGTQESVLDDKVEENCTFGDTLTENPAVVNGCTPVSADAKSVTIEVTGNEITFYYYKNVTLTANSDTKVYNGSEQTLTGYTGAPEGVTFEGIIASGSGTNFGGYPVNFSEGTVGTKDTADQYIITAVNPGKLTITENNAQITVTTKGGEFTYDGKAHGATVEVSELPAGYTLETATSNDTATHVGDGTVTANCDTLVIRNAEGEDVTANLNISYVDGTIKINPALLTVKTETASKTYDGTALTAEGSIKGFVNEETATFTVTGSQTTVGSSENTYELVWSTAKESNYTVTDTIGTLTVTRQSINPEDPTEPDPEDPSKPVYTGAVVNDPVDHEYDGAEHKFVPVVTDGGKTLTEGTDYEVTYSTENFTDVTGTITVTITGKGNYAGTVTKTYEITPKAVTVSTETASKVYDGVALTAGGEIKGIVEGETVTVKTTGSQTEVGSSDNPYELVWGTAEESNYTVTGIIGTLTVTEKSIVPDPTDPTNTMSVNEPENHEYDGEEHKFEPEVKDGEKVLVKGTDYTVSYDTEDFTNVTGTIIVTITGKGNYAGTVTKTYEITPKAVTVKAVDKSKTYGAADPTLTATIDGTLNGDEIVYSLARKTGEDVGHYTITPSGDATQGNYTITYQVGDFEITKSDGLTVTGESYDGTYDGKAHGEAAKASVTDGTTIGYSVDGGNTWSTEVPTITDVGTVDVKVKAENSNYVAAEADYTLTVTKRSVTLTSATDNKPYDGTPLTNAEVIVGGNGFVEGEVTDIKATGSVTTVAEGQVANTITYTKEANFKDGNYEISKNEGNLSITQNTTDLTVSGVDYTGTYDGQSHGEAATVSVTEGTAISYSVDGGTTWTETYPAITDVGTVNVTVKAENSNYVAATADYTLTMNPKAVTVSTETASKVYDGVALTAGGEIKGIVEGETVTVKTTGSQTEVGSSDNPYELVWGTAEESNYTLANETIGKLTVVPQSINPEDPETPTDPDEPIDPDQSYYGGVKVGTLNDVTYNGESQVQRPTVTDKDGNALTEGKDYTLTWNEETTNAGTVTVTVAGIGNYEGTVTRTYQINPRTVTLTSQTAAKAYDGTPLTGPNVAVTGNGFVAGEVTDVRANGTIINAGSVENTITYTVGEGFRPENYQITLNPGTLTVNPADQGIVTVTGNNDTFTWTGAAQTVTGYTHNGADRLITVNIDDAANAVATGVAVGHYDMGLTADNFTAESPNFRNVTVEVVDGYLDITPINATVTVTVRGSRQTAVYDGQLHTVQGYEVVSAIANTGRNVGMGGINLTLTGEASVTGTAVGTYAMGLTAEDFTITSDIYAVVRVAVEDGELVISPASIVPGNPGYNGVNVGTPADVVYNGENQQVRPDVTGANGNALTEGTDYTLTWSEDTTNVGTVSVTVTGIGNYDGTVTRTYRITPRNVVLTSETAAKIYDGTPLTRPDVAETGDGFVAGEVTNIAATGTITGIGTAENTITYTAGNDFRPGNYQVTLNPGTLTVTAQSIVPGNPNYTGAAVGTLDDVMYNGQSQQLRPIVTAADGSAMAEGTDYTLRWSADTTNAGTVVVTVTGIGNYSGSVIRTYRITPRTVTLTSQTAAKAYDGTPLTRLNVTVTGNGFVAGEVTGVRANGTITNAGSVVNTIAYTVGNGFRPGNYQVTLNPGTLTINPAAQGTVTVTGSTGTFTWTGDARTITGYTHNGAARLITVNIDNADNASVSGTDVGHYNMGLTAANFTAASPNYRNVTVEVVDGYLDIEPVNAAVTVTVRGNRETVAFDGQPHTVQGYEVVSAISNNGANVGLNSINLTFTGDDSVTGTEAGTYSMGLTAADFTITSDISASVRVVVQDGELVITPVGEPEEPEQTTGPEDIEDETVPLASGPEDIPDEEVPLAAAPAWALVNLILSILTVLGSLLLLIGFIGKKKEEVLDEDGNAILDAEGNSLMNQIQKHGGWRLGSLLPAILSVIAFILTEDMRNPMILVDRWTLLMVIIAVVQILVAFFSKKETEKSEEETAVSV